MSITEQTAINLVRDMVDESRSIRVPKVFIELTGDFTTAIFLSQCYYWQFKAKRSDNFFYKTDKEWEEEMMISKGQRQRATRTLMSMGILQVKLIKANGAPTNHYKLDMVGLLTKLQEVYERSETGQWIDAKHSNPMEQNTSNINIDDYIDDNIFSSNEEKEEPVKEKPTKTRARKEPQYPEEVVSLYQEVRDVLKRGAVSRDWLVGQLGEYTREEILEAARLAFKADAIRYPATYMARCLERMKEQRVAQSSPPPGRKFTDEEIERRLRERNKGTWLEQMR